MPPRIVDPSSAEHYIWGADCDGWHLVQSPGLSVIAERMPPSRCEQRHFHNTSRQFFYVLDGELTLEIDGHELRIAAGQGCEVAPGQPHQAINRGAADVRMLVISQPPSHGDRHPA